ncbi:hypothetical protein AURDEDRAFT_115408 [Auricularia subglabra TFB-10046 SS5]|nr:hypothetical protein AURDEDRAFT_115408 [Auricularia subglabra TFB-10046 SS5]
MTAPTNTAAPAAAACVPRAIAGRAVLKRQYAFYDVRDAGLEPLPKMPGAWNAGAAANAQTSSAAGAQQPSFMAAIISLAASVFGGPVKRKHDDDDELCDTKRRRVEPDAQPQLRAEGRQTTGKPASNNTTGATASSHHNLTAAAAPSAARDAPKNLAKPCRPLKRLVIRDCDISGMPTLVDLGSPPRRVPELMPGLLADNAANKAPEPQPAANGQSSGAAPAAALTPPSTPQRLFAAPSGPPPLPEHKRCRRRTRGDKHRPKQAHQAGAKGERKDKAASA